MPPERFSCPFCGYLTVDRPADATLGAVAGVTPDLARFDAASWFDVSQHQDNGFLNWGRTGITSAWPFPGDDDTYLLLPVTPEPWSYWLGLVRLATGQARPLVLFKNAVPTFEVGFPDARDGQPVHRRDWTLCVAAALTHNAGLTGLLEAITDRLPASHPSP